MWLGRAMTVLFKIAANILSGDRDSRPTDNDADAKKLLADLGYLSPLPDTNSELTLGRVCLLRAAARMKRLFFLPIESASRLIFMGGEADPAVLGQRYAGQPLGNTAGSGLTLRDAFEACVGEGIEYLSQFEQNDDLYSGSVEQCSTDMFPNDSEAWPSAPDDGWIEAHRLTDGAPALLPASRCLRRVAPSRTVSPPFMLGTGCGAGTSTEMATLHGLMELLERDAASLWWRGGCFGRPIPLE